MITKTDVTFSVRKSSSGFHVHFNAKLIDTPLDGMDRNGKL